MRESEVQVLRCYAAHVHSPARLMSAASVVHGDLLRSCSTFIDKQDRFSISVSTVHCDDELVDRALSCGHQSGPLVIFFHIAQPQPEPDVPMVNPPQKIQEQVRVPLENRHWSPVVCELCLQPDSC
jgi:hypothetical protein